MNKVLYIWFAWERKITQEVLSYIKLNTLFPQMVPQCLLFVYPCKVKEVKTTWQKMNLLKKNVKS